jgi:hypothetical protein
VGSFDLSVLLLLLLLLLLLPLLPAAPPLADRNDVNAHLSFMP